MKSSRVHMRAVRPQAGYTRRNDYAVIARLGWAIQ